MGHFHPFSTAMLAMSIGHITFFFVWRIHLFTTYGGNLWQLTLKTIIDLASTVYGGYLGIFGGYLLTNTGTNMKIYEEIIDLVDIWECINLGKL